MKILTGCFLLLTGVISITSCGSSSDDDNNEKPELKLVDEGLSDELLLSRENLLTCEALEQGSPLSCSLPANGLQFRAANDDFSEPLFFNLTYSLRCEGENGIADFQVKTDLQTRRLQFESADRTISLFGKGPIVLEQVGAEEETAVVAVEARRCYLELSLESARRISDIY